MTTTDIAGNDGARVTDDVRTNPGAERPDTAGARGARAVSDAFANGTAPGDARPGFLRRYRLPIVLGLVALCLYAGSILYILYGRGQIA